MGGKAIQQGARTQHQSSSLPHLDEHGRRAILGGFADVQGWGELVGRAVLGELGDDDASDEADDDAAKERPRNLRVEEDRDADRREDGRDGGREPHAVADDGEEGLKRRAVVELPVAYERDANERRDDAEAVNP